MAREKAGQNAGEKSLGWGSFVAPCWTWSEVAELSDHGIHLKVEAMASIRQSVSAICGSRGIGRIDDFHSKL
jgi:hypothetical protein